jgi:hypothetical protein
MSSPGKVVALALLWPTWTSTVDCGRSAYFVAFFVTLGLRWVFWVQTKLVAIIVIATIVAEPWRQLDSVDLKPLQ